jgi:hypothetical protein
MDFVDMLNWLGDPRVTWWSVDRKLSAFARSINII